MKIELLQYFYDVATTKSISKVASTSYITQSALSQQLQRLEEDFGTSLLIRSNKGVELTKEGEIVLKYSKYILKNYSNLLEELHSLKSGINSITINNDIIGSNSLLNAIQTLKANYPLFRFKISTTQNNTTSTYEVSNSDLCINLYYNTQKKQEQHSISLGSDLLVPVCNKDYHIKDMMNFSDLINEPFLYLTHNIISQVINKVLNKKGISHRDLNLLFTTNNYLDIIDALRNNLGFSLLPLRVVKPYIESGQLKEIKLTENLQLTFECCLTYNSKTIEPIANIIKDSFYKNLK